MHTKLCGMSVVGGLVLAFAVSASWANTVRVRGTIERVDGQTLVVKSRDGAEVRLVPADNVRVVGIVKASLSDIRPGSFVGVTGVPQADGSEKALEVHIFPEAMRGSGEGSRPWDLQARSMMTNASVEQVTKASVGQAVSKVEGRTLTVKYLGGEKRIVVPPDTPIVTYAPGDKSELTAGVKIFVSAAAEEPDGTLQASRISFGKDGLTPPM